MAFDASVSSMSMRAIFYAWVWSTPAIQVPGPGGGSSQELLTDEQFGGSSGYDMGEQFTQLWMGITWNGN